MKRADAAHFHLRKLVMGAYADYELAVCRGMTATDAS
jgi:hypothetical protein